MIHLVTCDFVIVNSVRNILVVSMKKFGLFCVALGLLALPSAAYAIDLTAAGASPTWDFATPPAAADFSSGTPAGADITITDTATMDAVIQGLTSGSFGAAVGSSATNPPTSTNALFRH